MSAVKALGSMTANSVQDPFQQESELARGIGASATGGQHKAWNPS